jgi:hypothetical protein
MNSHSIRRVTVAGAGAQSVKEIVVIGTGRYGRGLRDGIRRKNVAHDCGSASNLDPTLLPSKQLPWRRNFKFLKVMTGVQS